MIMHEIKYQFKKNSVTISYNMQNITFHSFNVKNKRPFNRFSRRLLTDKPKTINEVYRLAQREPAHIYSQGSDMGRVAPSWYKSKELKPVANKIIY